MKKCLFIGIITLFVASCDLKTDENNSEVNIDSSSISENTILVDLNKFGYDISVNVPDTVGKTLDIVQNEMSVGIFVDKRFHIAVGYDGDLDLKKEDLANDGMYQNEIISEDQNFIIYKSMLPDDSKTFYHFYGVKESNGEWYEIYDVVSENELSESSVSKTVEYLKK